MTRRIEVELALKAMMNEGNATSVIKKVDSAVDALEKKLLNLKVDVKPGTLEKGLRKGQQTLSDENARNGILGKYNDPLKVAKHYDPQIKKLESDVEKESKLYNKERQKFFAMRDSLSDLFMDAKANPKDTDKLKRLKRGYELAEAGLSRLKNDELTKLGFVTEEDLAKGLSPLEAFLNKNGGGTRNTGKKTWSKASLEKLWSPIADESLKDLDFTPEMRDFKDAVNQSLGFIRGMDKKGYSSVGDWKKQMSRLQKSFSETKPAEIIQRQTEMAGLQEEAWDRMTKDRKETFKKENPDWYMDWQNKKQSMMSDPTYQEMSQKTQLNVDVENAMNRLVQVQNKIREIKQTASEPIMLSLTADIKQSKAKSTKTMLEEAIAKTPALKEAIDGVPKELTIDTTQTQSGFDNLIAQATTLKTLLNGIGLKNVKAIEANADLNQLKVDQENQVFKQINDQIDGKKFDSLSSTKNAFKIVKGKLQGTFARYSDANGWENIGISAPIASLMDENGALKVSLEDLANRWRTEASAYKADDAMKRINKAMDTMDKTMYSPKVEALGNISWEDEAGNVDNLRDRLTMLRLELDDITDSMKGATLSPSQFEESARAIESLVANMDQMVTKAEQIQGLNKGVLTGGTGDEYSAYLRSIQELYDPERFARSFDKNSGFKFAKNKLTGTVDFKDAQGVWNTAKISAPADIEQLQKMTLQNLIDHYATEISQINPNYISQTQGYLKKLIDSDMNITRLTSEDVLGEISGERMEQLGDAIPQKLQQIATINTELDRILSYVQSNPNLAPTDAEAASSMIATYLSQYHQIFQELTGKTLLDEKMPMHLNSDDMANAAIDIKNAYKMYSDIVQETNEGLKVFQNGMVTGSIYRNHDGKWLKETISKRIDQLRNDDGEIDFTKLDPVTSAKSVRGANSLASVEKQLYKIQELEAAFRSADSPLDQLGDIQIRVQGEDRIVSVKERVDELRASLQQLQNSFADGAEFMNPKDFGKMKNQLARETKELESLLRNPEYQARNAKGELYNTQFANNLSKMNSWEAEKSIIQALQNKYAVQSEEMSRRQDFKLRNLDMSKGQAIVESHDDRFKYLDTVNFYDAASGLANYNNVMRIATKTEGDYLSVGQQMINGFKGKIKSIQMYMGGLMMVTNVMRQVQQGFQTITQLDSQLNNISMTMNASKQQLLELQSASIQMGKTMGMNATEVMQAATIYANANETTQSILEKAKPTVMLANASGQDTATASTQLQAVTQQFEAMEGKELEVVNAYEKISAGKYARTYSNVWRTLCSW